MAAELGFGVVGLGMGTNHCRSVTRANGAKLVAVCDVDEERLGPRLRNTDARLIRVMKRCFRTMRFRSSTFALSLESTPNWYPSRRCGQAHDR